jgi:ZIP family zinc transporter
MLLYLIALAAFVATTVGGLFALRVGDRLHLILGFSAGAVVAVAFFDLLPEGIELAEKKFTTANAVAMAGLGFLFYLILDRVLGTHAHAHASPGAAPAAPARARTGAGSLSFHSFLDGLGLGLAFQVSPALGVITAAAVLTHDFSDGINTVNLVLKNGGSRAMAFRWLLVDALAPVLGVIASGFLSVPEAELGLLLALFSGFFLYIGASDLVPSSHHAYPTRWTTISTVLGMATLFVITRLAGI